ncbi:MAG: HIT family protein [Prevotella sp.]|nr:HIT family protein [Staphylococcus sp.]MCM1350869.1 HIT family protein [Prevotella sp.]
MCVFCKIINGEIPAYKLYENGFVTCFLDISQATKGHCLVVPKKHIQDIFDLPEIYAEEVMKAATVISHLLKEKLGITDINLLNNSGVRAGQTVMHFHLHVLPRYIDDEIDFHQVDHEPNFAELDKLYAKLTQ